MLTVRKQFAGHQRVFAKVFRDFPGKFPDQCITGGMTEMIIDCLQVVGVRKDHNRTVYDKVRFGQTGQRALVQLVSV